MKLAMSTVAVGVLALGLVAPGCNKKKKEPAQQEAAQATDEAPPADSAERRRRPSYHTMVEVLEYEQHVPLPDTAKELTAPTKPKRGERIQATYCFDKSDPAAAAEAVKASLEQAGWRPIHVRPHPKETNRIALSAQRRPYRLTASFRMGDWPNCDGSDKKTYMAVTMHKVNERALEHSIRAAQKTRQIDSPVARDNPDGETDNTASP